MSNDAKSCLIAVIVVAIFFVILWYRNWSYDRLSASTLLVIGLLQLVTYGCYSSMEPSTAGILINLIAWLFVLVFIFGVYLYTRNSLALFGSLIILFIFIVVMINTFNGHWKYKAYVKPGSSDPRWSEIFGDFIIPVVLIFILGWFLLLKHHNWQDLTLFAALIYVIFVAIFVEESWNSPQWGPKFTYMLVGLMPLIFIFGLFV